MAPPSSGPKSGTISRAQVVSKRAPKLSTNKSLPFWRQRSRRRAQGGRVFTTGDLLLQAKKREERRRNYRDALHKAQDNIRGLAQELKERFGKYGVEHLMA